jgi:hypothetical protein
MRIIGPPKRKFGKPFPYEPSNRDAGARGAISSVGHGFAIVSLKIELSKGPVSMQRRHDGLNPPQKSPPSQWREDEYLNSYPSARRQPGAEHYAGIEHYDSRYRNRFGRRNDGGESGWWTDDLPADAPSSRPGPHTGKGPKGYRLSDDRIREEVSIRLWKDPAIDASDIEVEVAGGIVTLKGTVDERRTKRMAEELCEYLPGVRDVHNELRLNRKRHVNDSAPKPDSSQKA